jgi:dethiobiotin synthase
MRRIVVLGTGTSVGKTYVTTCLAKALHRRFPAAPIMALKPIETGVVAQETTGESSFDPFRACSDASALEIASFHTAPPKQHPLYAFVTPASAYRAATVEGRRVDIARIVYWLQHHTRQYDTPQAWLLVETAGGVFSPLDVGCTNLDLALALEPSGWLLIAPDALGVIHDVTATLGAMRSAARAPDWVVLSAARAPDDSTGSNVDELAELGVAQPVTCIGRNQPNGIDELVDALLDN